ncbi:hypothetical protein [Lentzea sp. NBRC 102530]|uniref:hypothetical protein n=1 Tax=Lentzea sp. NBRC 102530 TaxID=3032201 RepID=UPI0024A0BC19|nr:hypothetical protein [Lentzea sp. NBRC 102530]GLY55188.1 hypothetical protein Lesp01_88430 [Lentzea sp. NBRC 102530]
MSTPAGDGTPSIAEMLRPLPGSTSTPASAPVAPEPEGDEAPAGVSVRQLVIWCAPPLVAAGGFGLALVSTWALVIGLVVLVVLALVAWRWRHQLVKAWGGASGTSTRRGPGAGAGGRGAGGWGWRGGRRSGAGGHQAGGLRGRLTRGGRGAGGARRGGVRGAFARARQALSPAGIKRGARAAAGGARSMWRNTKAKATSAGRRVAGRLGGRRAATSAASTAHGAGGGRGSRWRPGRRRSTSAGGKRTRPGGRSTSAGGRRSTSTTSAGGKRTKDTTSAGGAGAPAGGGGRESVLDEDETHDWEREPRFWWRRNVARAGDLWFNLATTVGDEVRAGANGRVATALKTPFVGLFKRKPKDEDVEPVDDAPADESTVWRFPVAKAPTREVEPDEDAPNVWTFGASVPKPRTADSVPARSVSPVVVALRGDSRMTSATLESLVPALEDASTPQSKINLLTEAAASLRRQADAKDEDADKLERTAQTYEGREGMADDAERMRAEVVNLRTDAETYRGEALAADELANGIKV